MATKPYRDIDRPGAIGKVVQPASGEIRLEAKDVEYPFFKLRFVFDKARVPVTDAAASGSFGSIKLFDFVEQAVGFRFSRLNLDSVIEGAALTGGAGDAAFKLGVGSAGIAAAADNALTGTSVNLAAALSLTNAGGTSSGGNVNALNLALDGTTTALALFLNFSGSAATIDANSFIDITGDLTITGEMLDDD